MALSNLFLLINLGCEMLYIIDQRLSAQNIAKDKAAQVLREVTSALLSPQFFNYVSTAFTEDLISVAQVRIILSDIASCSLMRLDHQSLDKLLDLMIMIFKWQLFLIANPDELYHLTLRHLHVVGRLFPEQAKMILIDQSNQFFFNHWRELNEENRYGIVRKLNKFLSPFNIRISLLIRMKLQLRDGSFVDKVDASSNEFFRYYINNLGENVYEKTTHFPHCQVVETKPGRKESSNEINCLFQQFTVDLQDVNEVRTCGDQKVQRENETFEQINALDELKKKCKMDVGEEAPPIYEDNFAELLSMLDENQL